MGKARAGIHPERTRQPATLITLVTRTKKAAMHLINTEKWATERILDHLAIIVGRNEIEWMVRSALSGLAVAERSYTRSDGSMRHAFGNRPNGLIVLQHCQLLAVRERIDASLGEDW